MRVTIVSLITSKAYFHVKTTQNVIINFGIVQGLLLNKLTINHLAQRHYLMLIFYLHSLGKWLQLLSKKSPLLLCALHNEAKQH